MTCGACVAKAKSELLKIGDVASAEVSLTSPQATITMSRHIPTADLQSALSKAGNYIISENNEPSADSSQSTSLTSYKPLLIIAAYIFGITISLELTAGYFEVERWMMNFMAAFFLAFSFFKLLDLKGFAESYSTYDIIAKKWNAWGYVYPFIELILGIGYLFHADTAILNGVTLVVMTVSIVGVVQVVANKRKIQCACLGAVFNLPMSTITIIEDALMIVMSGIMLMNVF
jgi:cation transport ATPase